MKTKKSRGLYKKSSLKLEKALEEFKKQLEKKEEENKNKKEK